MLEVVDEAVWVFFFARLSGCLVAAFMALLNTVFDCPSRGSRELFTGFVAVLAVESAVVVAAAGASAVAPSSTTTKGADLTCTQRQHMI